MAAGESERVGSACKGQKMKIRTTPIHSTLLSRRIRSCAVSATVLGIMDFALFMADFVISGQFLGAEALAGLAAMNPLITFLTFINIIIPSSTLSAISAARGEGNIDRANKLFSQGIIISFILGAISSLIMFVLSSSYAGSSLLPGNIAGFLFQFLLFSSSLMLRITLQGFPTARELGGISLFTMLPAPMTEPEPIVIPGSMETSDPIQTLSSIVTG